MILYYGVSRYLRVENNKHELFHEVSICSSKSGSKCSLRSDLALTAVTPLLAESFQRNPDTTVVAAAAAAVQVVEVDPTPVVAVEPTTHNNTKRKVMPLLAESFQRNPDSRQQTADSRQQTADSRQQ